MKNNKLIEYGKAAASLCNDWRDTIFYTGLAACAVDNAALGWGISSHDFALAASQRELLRAVAWRSNSNHCMSSASTLGAAFLTEDLLRVGEKITGTAQHYSLSVPSLTFGVALDLAVMAMALPFVGGPKAVLKDYRDLLFDWPRKNKPPGGRRNVIAERFHDLADWVRDTITPPRPAWGALPSRRRPIKMLCLRPRRCSLRKPHKGHYGKVRKSGRLPIIIRRGLYGYGRTTRRIFAFRLQGGRRRSALRLQIDPR